MKKNRPPVHLPIFIWTGLSLLILAVMFVYVDLKPVVDESLFFSNEDPQLKEDKKISRLFSQPSQLIVSAKGDLHSEAYNLDIRNLSDAFLALPEVYAVQSLSHGPDGVEDALKSPLWKRTILSKEEDASFILIFLRHPPKEAFISQIEKMKNDFQKPGFELMVSGGPYIVEMIRRNLYRDLQVFSLTALVVLSISLLFVFRSLWIAAGTIVSCIIASALALIFNQVLHIEMGFLTSNLSTIVFVLTLSHITFLTADWKRLMEAKGGAGHAGWKAAWGTFEAALWSTCTALLGFLSLFFVQAKSLRQFGFAGSIGVLFALFGAYVVYPWFLDCEKTKPDFFIAKLTKGKSAGLNIKNQHGWIVVLCGVLMGLSLLVFHRLNTDPSLFTYFKKGGELRNGLEYIDRNGGSNPLNLVVSDPENPELNTKDAVKKMWLLHEALEKDPAVGSAVSIPLLLAEAKRSPFSFLLSNEMLMSILGSPRFGEISKYFVTDDRKQALFMLRMNEGALKDKRLAVVERIRQIVIGQKFKPDLIGGVFMLQGRLAALVNSSLISGGIFLNGVILVMTWFLSRSWRVAGAMLASLYFVPAVMFGILGLFRVPLDVISAPAVNLAIGMGVDSMIHMVILIRRKGLSIKEWNSWAEARSNLFEPILWSTLVVCAGFAIFILSTFPPTQRFGASVVLGTVLTPFGALFILPYLAGATFPFLKKRALSK